MIRIEEITIGLGGGGMIVRDLDAPEGKTECYAIRDAGLYVEGNQEFRPVPISRLWLIWFGSLPIPAAIIYLLIQVFGS